MTDPILATALVIALGLAIRFYVNWKRAVVEVPRLSDECDEQRRRAWRAEDELKATKRTLADTERKWLDMKSRYLDSLDEIAAMKAASDRGPEAAE